MAGKQECTKSKGGIGSGLEEREAARTSRKGEGSRKAAQITITSEQHGNHLA